MRSDHVVDLIGVRKTYGAEVPVTALDSVTLRLRPGEFVAIEGPSGSGKSTLLNILALLDTPSGGDYRFLGQDVRRVPARDLARIRSESFGFIFQSFHLMLRRTARENVELGLLYRAVPQAERRVLAAVALERVGLHDRADTMCSKLSGGERQRVAIARAVVGRPRLVVADEPTGSLDSVNGARIVEQLRALNTSGTTVLMVTHDGEVAARADRRIVLGDGVVRADVTTEVGPVDRSSEDRQPLLGRPSALRSADLLRESWRALASRPGRFAILVAAVGLAVGLVVITAGLSQTASAQVSATFDARLNREVGAVWRADPSPVALDAAELERAARGVAGVERAGVAGPLDGIRVRLDPLADPREAAESHGYLVSDGMVGVAGARVRWVPGHRGTLGRREVLIGRLQAEDLGLGPLELAPVVSLDGSAFAVAGIVEDGGRLPDLLDAVAVGYQDASLVGLPARTQVLVRTRQGAAQQVARQLPIALVPANPRSVTVSAPVDPSTLQRDVTGEVRAALLAVSAVALLASVLGVANAMLLGVIERIGELGLRRAIGARSVHVLAQSAAESALVGILGGLCGTGLGLGTVLAITLAHRWAPVIDLRIAPLAVVGGAMVGILGGLPASIRASRINPADALRR